MGWIVYIYRNHNWCILIMLGMRMSSGEYYISQTKWVTRSDWLTSCSPIHTEPLHWWVLLILWSQGHTAHPLHYCENLEGLQTSPLTCLAGSVISKECLPWSVHPPPRRKSGPSVNRLLLSPLQVEVEKKQSSVRALWTLIAQTLCCV